MEVFRRPCLLLLLVLSLAGASSARDGSPSTKRSKRLAEDSSHRVILRFADPHAKRSNEELLRERVRDLASRPGVVRAKALERVGMAIAECDSLESEEQLVRALEDDPEVELATPDSWVHFDGAAQGFGKGVRARDQQRPFQDLRKCSAQSGCAALGLVGLCCPAPDGMMLACCDGGPSQNQVSLRSSHGEYVVAEEDGEVDANRAEARAWETFQLIHNADETISLRSHFGKYVGANDHGEVRARSELIGGTERFTLIKNKDSTVSFKSSFGLYVVAEEDGRLNANRDKIGDWEKFEMKPVGGSNQRFPNDPNFTALWGMHQIGKDNDIDAPEAWSTFTGEFSAGIVVAVIDTGIDYNHEDLRANMWVNPGEIPENGIDDDGNGFVDDVHGVDFVNDDGDPMDDQRHGTHCAGTIAGVGNNAIGVTGVAWHGVKLMALKFLAASGGGKTSDAVRAIDYAIAHGAKITSNSWGGGGSSAALAAAIEKAEAAGILFMAAAGNSNSDNDESPHYPSNYGSDNIVSVASTTSDGLLSGFSSYGATTVDLAAPGSMIFSTVPKNQYKYLSGTSMATPHVSGLAALVWMYRPSLSMLQVKDILMSTVRKLEALEGKCLSGGLINARLALEAAAATAPPRPPVHAPRGVAFKDVDPKVGLISGTVTITRAADESDVDYYEVYFVSHAGYQLDALGRVNATGAEALELQLGAPRPMPHYAAGLVAVSGNASGEMPAQIGGRAPNVTVRDYVVPAAGPRAVEWAGDVDLREGVVAGKLVVTRAADEASITKYNVYWSNNSRGRGQLLGSIPANGFTLPKCTGPTCALINATASEGGRIFNRGSYSDQESAVIKASGPATVKVTRFDTESYYDTLTVGSRELSGSPKLPMKLEIPEGPMTIAWLSDDSVTAGGWTFELIQTGAKAELDIAATALRGRGLEVVPAYGETELPQGVFVELADYTKKMPPSPGYAPEAVRFADVDNATGVIAGVVEVVPARGASGASSVTYYQLEFADAEGKRIGEALPGARASANGNKSVFIPLSTVPLPAGAAKLVARAGNSYGLSSGQASADIADNAVGRASSAVAADKSKQGTGAHDAGTVATAEPGDIAEEPAEPWLARPDLAQERRTVWTAPVAPRLSSSRAGEGHILSAVTFPGLDSQAIAGEAFRKAFRHAVHAQLPYVGVEDVTITRIFETVSRAGRASPASPHHRRDLATTVEFRLEPTPGAPPRAASRIESRLLLLSMGGRSAEHLHRELLARLDAAGARLPAGTRSQVRPPQQLAPARRSSGRKLAAAGALVGVGGRSGAALSNDRGEEVALVAVVAATLAAACAAVLVLAIVRNRRGHSLAKKQALAALDGVHVQPDSGVQSSVDGLPASS